MVQQLWDAGKGDGSALQGLLTVSRPVTSCARAPAAPVDKVLAPRSAQDGLQHAGEQRLPHRAELPQPVTAALATPDSDQRSPSPLQPMAAALAAASPDRGEVKWLVQGSSSSQCLLQPGSAGQQGLGLPWDFAWSLLLERSMFDAPFPREWLSDWLESHFRSQQQ